MPVTKFLEIVNPDYYETHRRTKRFYDAPRSTPADPVTNEEDMKQIRNYILGHYRHGRRNWMIFLFGVYTGRRCGDVLKMKVCQVVDEYGRARGAVRYTDQKTSRDNHPNHMTLHMNEFLRNELVKYIAEYKLRPQDYLFPSQKKRGNQKRVTQKGRDVTLPDGMMSVDSYGKILRQVYRDLELNFHLSTHSMRKTCGYNIFNSTHSLEATRDALGHRSTQVTMRYIRGFDDHVGEIFDGLMVPGTECEEDDLV